MWFTLGDAEVFLFRWYVLSREVDAVDGARAAAEAEVPVFVADSPEDRWVVGADVHSVLCIECVRTTPPPPARAQRGLRRNREFRAL